MSELNKIKLKALSQTCATIGINELEVLTTIGINPNELDRPQKIYISINFDVDIKMASVSDDIRDTVDYDSLSKSIVKWIKESNVKLLEALVYELKQKLIQTYPIKNIDLIIKKPSALDNAKFVFIQLNENAK